MIDFMYPAEDGRVKTLNFCVNSLDYAETVLTEGERVDGSSLFPTFVEAGNSDLYVIPRYRTAFMDPFTEIPTLCFLCSFYDKNGDPFECAPYHTLMRAEDAFYASTGLTFEAMGELEFTPQMEGSAVVRRLADTFFKRVQALETDSQLSADQLHQIVTLASIVEREYRVASEAPLIASVFTNRLRNNIGLYSCATIEYIITEIEGLPHPDRITYADLAIDSPYNTYKWAGLPPGPISNPGMTALNAASHPADTSYYYFVLTDPATGSHTFTSTFDAHIAAENSTSYVSKQ